MGPHVWFTDKSGKRQFCRIKVVPKNDRTSARSKVRALMSYTSGLFSLKLTDPQREQWIAAALTAPTHGFLGRYGNLSGQQLEVKLNMTRLLTGQQVTLTPPEPVVFSANPVTALEAVQTEAGARLLLSVGTVSEDIMVFGQPPCSAGRMKHRRVYYLGLVGSVTNGQADITDLYTAKFGAPAPGKKVFIVTCQTKNGWKAQDHVFSAIVPPPPPSGQAASACRTSSYDGNTPSKAAIRLRPRQALFFGVSSRVQGEHTGCTRGAQGPDRCAPGEHPSYTPCTRPAGGSAEAGSARDVWGACGRRCYRLEGTGVPAPQPKTSVLTGQCLT